MRHSPPLPVLPRAARRYSSRILIALDLHIARLTPQVTVSMACDYLLTAGSHESHLSLMTP